MRRSAWLLALATACGSRVPPRVLPAANAGAGWSYDVVASPGGAELHVQASFAPGSGRTMSVEGGAEPFLHDVEVQTSTGWVAVAPNDGSWTLPSCDEGCRVRYRYALAEIARDQDDVTIARGDGAAIEAPPSTWLLRPERAVPGFPIRFHVQPAPGELFMSGVFPAPGAPDTYEARTEGAYQMSYSAIGRIRPRAALDGVVQVAILPGDLSHESDVLAWVERSARAVAGFYGRFPVKRLLLIVRPRPGRGAGFGTTMGHSGASIAIDVGTGATAAGLEDDWILVHEMVHTALPDIQGPQHWLEEGLATYVEPLARHRAGILRAEDVWSDWVHGMPNGLPVEGDQGLDRTETWGRTYWGGALFCLVADVTIRERTHGAHSLEDALRAIVAQGGNISEGWPIEKILDVGDRATGVPVLHELYADMSVHPTPVDLEALWKRLGIAPSGKTVVFDDAAPLAAMRNAMTPKKP